MIKNYFLILFTILLFFSYKKNKVYKKKTFSKTIKYATGFDIQNHGNDIKLIIKNPYPNAKKNITYILSKNKTPNSIKIPIKKIIVTSTTHIPMIELLKKEHSLVGFPNIKYISSEKTRNLVENGKIKEIGDQANLNTEILLELQPDVVVDFSMQKTNKSLNFIEQNKIPVLLNGDWLESTPLGRAEWIKFFGVLFNKQKQADSIFKIIEKNYLVAKKIARKFTNTPSVFSGAIMQKDIWSLPGGKSFISKFLEDANSNYLWKNNNNKGSLQLSFESVLDKAQNADYWISPGFFNTKKQMLNSNKNYNKFYTFKNNKIYTPNNKKGLSGGIIYFELGPTRPDLVLKDFIKILHPNSLPNYNFTFFEQMK